MSTRALLSVNNKQISRLHGNLELSFQIQIEFFLKRFRLPS